MTLPEARKIGQHAVVMGGSLAGLLATRILADYFERVTLVERDPFPTDTENHKGVPQGNQPHLVLEKGYQTFSRLLPDLPRALLDGGATMVDMGADLRWFQLGGYKVKFDSGIVSPFMTRGFLEQQVRRLVLALPNVTALDESSVEGLVASDDCSAIIGVRVRRRSTGGGEEILSADFVVDATGRGSRTPVWLVALGYQPPQEDSVKLETTYVSRLYRRKPDDLVGAKVLYISPTAPQQKRVGVVFPVEGDRWMAALVGRLGDKPPTDDAGYLEFARTMPAPDIYNLLSRAEPVSDYMVYHFTANVRRRYDLLARVPGNFVVFGDALCSFNPLYGQGITLCALEGEVLEACLGSGVSLRDFPQRFFKGVAKATENAWMLATGEDFRYPETEGQRPPPVKFINWYVSKVQQAALRDQSVHHAFLNVMNMTQPPTTLFAPGIMLKVLGA